MIYAYIRVSTSKQDIENQKYEIMQYCDERRLLVDEWVQESVSSRQKLESRELSSLIAKAQKKDIIICTELSRLGRSLFEVMGILNQLMEKDVKVFSIKEGYELGNNINSKVLAFAFGLAGEIERDLISQRTKSALSKRKAQGLKLGRPKGSTGKSKLDDKQDEIKELLAKKVSVASIAKIYNVQWLTMNNYIKSRKLKNKDLTT